MKRRTDFLVLRAGMTTDWNILFDVQVLAVLFLCVFVFSVLTMIAGKKLIPHPYFNHCRHV